jgi:biopolymer transport protein ExbD
MSNAKSGGLPAFIDLPTAMRLYKRRKKLMKKAKEAASEIRELNIVAMVDVLTILLIFLLKSVSVSSTIAPDTPNMVLPLSTTQQPPIEAVKVVVAADKIYVEDEVVATIKGGAVPDSEADPDSPMLVPGLQTALRNWIRLAVVSKGAEEKQLNLQLLADKGTPYQILLQVFYTAGQSNVDVADHTFAFTKYRLMVQRNAE